jgi:hypothetical protein
VFDKTHTVIYEVQETEHIIVVLDTGEFLWFRNTDGMREYILGKHVYIVDCKASAVITGGPSNACNAYGTRLIISSPNSNAYRQIMRNANTLRYTIPSYTFDELLSIRDQFDVSDEVMRTRLSLLGPSVRNVFCSSDTVFAASCASLKKTATEATKKGSADYILNMGSYGHGLDNPVSASLMVATVDLPTYTMNPLAAYEWANIRWQFASPYIVDLVRSSLCQQQDKQIEAVITRVSERKISIMKGFAGNYLLDNGVAAKFISKGGFRYRQLQRFTNKVKDAMDTTNKIEVTQSPQQNIVTPDPFPKTVEEAFISCDSESILYDLIKSFPGLDLVSCSFRKCYQVTTSHQRIISLRTIKTVCEYVRSKFGPQSCSLWCRKRNTTKDGLAGNYSSLEPKLPRPGRA